MGEEAELDVELDVDLDVAPMLQQKKPKKHKKRTKLAKEKLRHQMEFYFSEANLHKDRFVKKLMDESKDGFIDLEVFTKFNKIKEITEDVKLIAAALQNSDLLQISEDKKSVKRKMPLRERKDVDERTVYVECLPEIVTHDWVTQTFSMCGKVEYVSLPRYKTTRDFKGFGFVEFSKIEEAEKACDLLNNPPASIADKAPGKFPRGCRQIMSMKYRLGEDDPITQQQFAEEEEEEEKFRPNKRKMEESLEDGPLPKKEKVKHEEEVAEVPKEVEAEATEVTVREENVKIPVTCMKKRKMDDSFDQEEKEAKKVRISEVVEVREEEKAKKKRKKEKKKIEVPELRVISKKQWLLRKQEYLALQRKCMHDLKESMRKMKHPEQAPKQAEKKPVKEIDFTPDVIVKVSSAEALTRKTLMESFSSKEEVAYIDVKDGQTVGFIRCHHDDGAKAILELTTDQLQLSLLQGEDETAYWTKLITERQEKYKAKKKEKPRRGKEKVVDQAEKYNKHIQFNEDD